MRNKFDYLGKLIVAAGTTTPQRVQKEFSILSEEQSADCYVIEPEAIETASTVAEVPDLHRPYTRIGPRGVALPRGGWLGEITSHECLVEAFHQAPDVQEVNLCMQKQFNLRAHLRRDAKSKEALARVTQLPLWIISGGDPKNVRREFGFAPIPNWTAGFYTAVSGLSLHLVVTSELELSSETLLLRLMGADKTFDIAVANLLALSEHQWEVEALLPWMRKLRLTKNEIVAQYPDEREAVMSITAWSEEIDRKLETRGIEKGKLEGKIEGKIEGITEGVVLERRNGLVRSAAKRLKRALSESEQQALLANAKPENWDAIDDAIFADDERELLSWLVART